MITHGGNNTVTESLYFGKPMIVMPLFGDQYDNAQRIHEKGLGIRMDPYECDKKELISAVEKLVNDRELAERMKLISQRVQAAKNNERAADLIESIVK